MFGFLRDISENPGTITLHMLNWIKRSGLPAEFPDQDSALCLKQPNAYMRTGVKYLEWVSDFVSKYKNKCLSLKSPAGAILRIAGLEDTIYRGKHDEVNGWGKFYLPEIVNMKVIGVLEGTSCPCEQLVLMTCEDKKLYAYDGEELHLVALGFEQLRDKEIEYPASKSYYNGEAFKHMTEEDWKVVKRGAVGRKLEQEHQKLVKANKAAFFKSLKL